MRKPLKRQQRTPPRASSALAKLLPRSPERSRARTEAFSLTFAESARDKLENRPSEFDNAVLASLGTAAHGSNAKEGLFITGSRNTKAEFFAKFSSCSSQNSALTRFSLYSASLPPNHQERSQSRAALPPPVTGAALRLRANRAARLEVAERGAGRGRSRRSRLQEPRDRCKQEVCCLKALGVLSQLTSARLSMLLSPGTWEPVNTYSTSAVLTLRT